MNVSMTGAGLAGLLVWLVVYVGKYFGIEVLEADAIALVTNLIASVSLVLAYYGQWRRKDLVGGIFRK